MVNDWGGGGAIEYVYIRIIAYDIHRPLSIKLPFTKKGGCLH